MIPALFIAKTGLDAQQTRLGVISNNLANASTTGFKKGRPVFEALLYQNLRQVGAQSTQNTQFPSGLSLGTGVRTVATEKIHSQGNLVQTDNALDVAIQGRGFIQILQPDGTIAYTRDGTLQVDLNGQIVNSNGLVVQPAVTIPTGALSITISTDGIVSALTTGQAQATQIGTLQLADFINPAGLQPIGQNLFLESGSSGTPTTGNPGLNGLGTLIQGALEASNVNTVEELVNMIEAQRTFEVNSKAVQAVDQMLQFVNNTLSR